MCPDKPSDPADLLNEMTLESNFTSESTPTSTSSPNLPISATVTPQSPPVSSHSQLSSDIQARIMAFQQQRANKKFNNDPTTDSDSDSVKTFPVRSNSNKSSNSSDHSSGSTPTTEKTCSGLPTVQMRSFSSNDAADYTAIPSPKIPLTPQQLGRLPNHPAIGPSPTTSNAFSDMSRKSSLSQRRGGLKLNINDLNKGSPGSPLSPPISLNDGSDAQPSLLNSTGELSRRLSERKKKPNFKLNLQDDKKEELHRGEEPKPQLQGLFANYSKYVDIKSGSLNFTGKASLHSKGVDFSSGSSFHISLDQLEFIEELGRGNYGTVTKVLHKPTGVLMAMKEVRLELDEKKFTQILMELEVLHKCHSPYIVDFYGAFFVEGAVYMCMEYMEGGSLDKVYEKDVGIKNEKYLAFISESVIRGLKELKDEHNIIHRDVKPTNILVNSNGRVKLCDFGVSGNLVASLAKTNIGCQSYMAPERIKALSPDDVSYSVQSDIWSLGLTILEIAKGNYPYPAETYDNIFSQLSAIVDGDTPKLDPKHFSKEAQLFVRSCLNKNPDLRPSYQTLLNSPWLQKFQSNGEPPESLNIYVQERINQNKLDKEKPVAAAAATGHDKPASENVSSILKGKVRAPALHRGGLFNSNRRFANR